jgi:hypothetical protein
MVERSVGRDHDDDRVRGAGDGGDDRVGDLSTDMDTVDDQIGADAWLALSRAPTV